MPAKNIIEELKKHHDEMRKLVAEIKKNKPEKFVLLKKHLDVHHELEEDLLLSHLNTKRGIKDESLESQEEHFVLNILLLDLKDFPKDHYRWMVKFKVFDEILDHHLTEEEEDLFPDAEKKLDKKLLEEMGEKFATLKEKRLSAAFESKDDEVVKKAMKSKTKK